MIYLIKLFLLMWLLFLVSIRPANAQQYSFTSGSDLVVSGYSVHITIGQMFTVKSNSSISIDDGLLSILTETIVLGNLMVEHERIEISPNPFVNQIALFVPNASLKSPADVSIYSIQGYLQDKFVMDSPSRKVDLAHVLPGTYLVSVQFLGERANVFKVIKIN